MCVVSAPWDLVLVAVMGLFVGAVAVAAFRISEHQMRGPTPQEPKPVSPDEAALLAALREGVVLLDHRGRVLRADATARSLGIINDDALAPGPIRTLYGQVRASGELVHEDIDVPCSPLPQAAVYHLTVRIHPLSHDRTLITIADRTEKVRLDNIRRDFMQNVSHELKTPVGALSLLAETVHESADDPDAVRHFSDRMMHESRRLARLVTEIIELSRLESPNALVRAETVSIDEVVAEAIDRVRVTAAAAQIGLTSGGMTGLQVRGDASLLMTAVRNLLDNAIRYSPAHASVNVATTGDDEVVKIVVVDEGVGLTAEQRARVFERFYRVDDARSRETGGTGLGLAIVKHIASDHGGSVAVWSAPGKGSTFTLTLPRAHTSVRDSAAESQTRQKRVGPGRKEQNRLEMSQPRPGPAQPRNEEL